MYMCTIYVKKSLNVIRVHGPTQYGNNGRPTACDCFAFQLTLSTGLTSNIVERLAKNYHTCMQKKSTRPQQRRLIKASKAEAKHKNMNEGRPLLHFRHK